MHYYKRNLGDYAKKTGRLSMLQHGAYTLLLDSCYDRERFPTKEEAIDWTWASTPEEISAVEFVLSKFFSLQDGVYVQLRIADELIAYQAKAEKNKRIANERETNRREKKTERTPNVHETSPDFYETPPNQEPRTTNQELQTINQEPETKRKNTKVFSIDAMLEIGPELAMEFMRHRKAVKAPLSAIAWDQFVKEAGKAGWTVEEAVRECIGRGWKSFKADWVTAKTVVAHEYQMNPFSDNAIEGECYESE